MARRTAAVLVLIAALALGLRVWRLDAVPPGFFIDESSIGANAWSVARTGHDVHGVACPVLFRALEDWKHPLYVYGAVASEGALGPTRFAVRLPAAVFGALTVLLLGLLAFELLRDERVAIAASAILAVTPWHVQYSRMAWEAVTMGFAFVLALWVHAVARRRRSAWLFAAAGAAFGLALFSYTPAKLLVPAFVATLGVLELRAQKDIVPLGRRELAAFGVALGLVAAPMVVVQLAHWDAIQTRFRAVSVFREASPLAAAASSYATHLGFGFLFVAGDANARQGWHGWGELLLATAPLVAFGLVRCLRARERPHLLLLAWVLLYPLGACLTSEGVPHASRAFLGAPLGALLAAVGFGFLVDGGRERKQQIAIAVLVGALVAGNAGLALRDYFVGYATKNAAAWNEGVQDLVPALEKARGGELSRVHFAPGADLVRDDVLFFGGFDPAKLDSEKPDPYYDWLPPRTDLARALDALPPDEALVARLPELEGAGGQRYGTFVVLRGRRK